MAFTHDVDISEGGAGASRLNREQVREALTERTDLMVALHRETDGGGDHTAATSMTFASAQELDDFTRDTSRAMGFLRERSATFTRFDETAAAAAADRTARDRTAAAVRQNAIGGNATGAGAAPDDSPFADHVTPFRGLAQLIMDTPVWRAARAGEDHRSVVVPFGALTAAAHDLAPGQVDRSIAAEAASLGVPFRADRLSGAEAAAQRSDFDASPPRDLIPGIYAPQRRTDVLDMITMIPTSRTLIGYRIRQTRTNTADWRAETAAYARVALSAERYTESIRGIGAIIQIADWLEADDLEAMAMINAELPQFLREKAETDLITGSGVAPNVRGLQHPQGGSHTSVAKGANETNVTTLMKAIRDTEDAGLSTVDAIAISRSAHGVIERERDDNGQFIYRHPSEGGPLRILGAPLLPTPVAPANAAVVGQWSLIGAHMRSGLDLEYGYIDKDFEDGEKQLRIGWRLAYSHRAPAAFRTVTDLDN